MHMVDWYPTFSRLAGVKATGEQTLPLDGMDVWPMLSEGKKSPHEAILVAQGLVAMHCEWATGN